MGNDRVADRGPWPLCGVARPCVPSAEHSMAVSLHLYPNQLRMVGGVRAGRHSHRHPWLAQCLPGSGHFTHASPVASSTLHGDDSEAHVAELKLQYSGRLMPRADSLEMTLMLGKIEGRRRGKQRMR